LLGHQAAHFQELALFFTWDPRKNTANLRKHGVSFEEASSVLSDSLSVTGADPGHSIGESRWITFGISDRGRLISVFHADHRDMIRIISARLLTRSER
jgi:uncharacterized DUF497 family protein